MKYLIIATIFSLIVSGYSNSSKKICDSSDKLYEIAKKKIQNNDWKQAILKLNELSKNYQIDSSFFYQIQLDLIYSYYKNSELSLAKSTIDRFIRLNPIHPNIDYVIYMRGIINMDMDSNALQQFFKIDRSSCDPKYAKESLNDFINLKCNYPSSQYISNAVKRIELLENRLANYEYLIASYYARCGAWTAVVNRVNYILKNYPNAQITKNSLKLIDYAYRKIEIDEQAKQPIKTFPNKKKLSNFR